MIMFKACPKCKGDLYLNRDMYGKYVNCFQCGYLKDLTSEEEIFLRELVTAVEERKAA
jgi:DNA-directed RNA polymerase subunit M/transcription elongation factor TFIIS